jgi:hypothetical protein
MKSREAGVAKMKILSVDIFNNKEGTERRSKK